MGEGPISWFRQKRLRLYIAGAAVLVLGGGAATGATVAANASTPLASQLASEFPGYHLPSAVSPSLYSGTKTATPIQHLVVIFDENESFDHYFGTYPYAANTDGTPFYAKPGTPTVNGLYSAITSSGPIGPLLTDNPNKDSAGDQLNPQRIPYVDALTTSQNHGYTPEQKAADDGREDGFVLNTQSEASATSPDYGPNGIVLDYFDGNTTTALWNYAQNYAMDENDFDPNFGPSTVGAVNVVSGDTGGAQLFDPTTGAQVTIPAGGVPGTLSVPNSAGISSIIGDPDPFYDQCADGNHTSTSPLVSMTGQNIGDLLNTKHVTWGWFQGGFAPSTTNAGGAVCGNSHTLTNASGTAVSTVQDYVPHHSPFEYYASTSNPAHLAPSKLSLIGYTDQANHNYDVSDFTDALEGTGGAQLPAVSYIKPPAYENAHPGNSDPLEEQNFVVSTINQIEKSKYWSSTAIVITYDDSDGWYDHVEPPVLNGSNDGVNDTAICSSVPITVGSDNGRCGFGQRLPFLVISPYAPANTVSNTQLTTASVVRFIEDNWLKGERIPGSFDAVSGSIVTAGLLNFGVKPNFTPLILNPTTGAEVSGYGFWNTSKPNGH